MTPEAILKGKAPADALREFLAEDLSRVNGDAAIWFCDYFPNASDEARHLIWNLRTNVRTNGIPDEQFNVELIALLRNAGYVAD